jgi:ribonucleoside-diphosphate reductase alpha chain
MNNDLYVTKRNGERELLDLDKIHRVIDWSAKDLDNVSVSQVEIKAHIQFYDGIKTEDIHETMIKSAADLISTDSPDYTIMSKSWSKMVNTTNIFLKITHQRN